MLTARFIILDGDVERAGEGGAHGGHGGNRTGLIEANVATELERLSIGQAGGVHFAAHPVKNDLRTSVVPIRPGLTKIGNAGVNQVWIDGG